MKKKRVTINIMKDILLKESQIDHSKKLKGILGSQFYAMDLSMLGTGKTYVALDIFKYLSIKNLMVIAPLSVLNKWDDLTEGDYNGITYAGIRSKSGRIMILKDGEYKITEYTKTLIDEGLFIVIDEFHNLKNDTAQNNAVKILLKEMKINPNNKVLMLSGSPIDKKVQSLNYCYMLGITGYVPITIYDKNSQKYDSTGFDNFVRHCKRINLNTQSIVRGVVSYKCSKSELMVIVYELFTKIMIEFNSSSMKPFNLTTHIVKYNSHYVEDDKRVFDSSKFILTEINDILLKYIEDKKDTINTFGKMTRHLKMLELLKINIFYREVVNTILKSDCKVIVGFNFTNSQILLGELLGSMNIKSSILNGGVHKISRRDIVDKFNQDDDELRVLICNIEVISTGIDLDDKFGNRPRVVYLSPSYNTISQYQVSHRVSRLDSKSNSEINMVIMENNSELRVLDALKSKSMILRDNIQTGRECEYFPGHYNDRHILSRSDIKTPENYDLGLLASNLYNFDKVFISESNHGDCPICLASTGTNKAIKVTKCCKNFFHQDCLDKWIVMKRNCPLCKEEKNDSLVLFEI
jgi:hypothetical protein